MKNTNRSHPNPGDYKRSRKKRHPDLMKSGVAQLMLQQMFGQPGGMPQGMPPSMPPQGGFNG